MFKLMKEIYTIMIANYTHKTHKDAPKVTHNKLELSKVKELDFLEGVINTFTKPVDKIHNSNFMSKGKKPKKTKKTKKIKLKKS